MTHWPLSAKTGFNVLWKNVLNLKKKNPRQKEATNCYSKKKKSMQTLFSYPVVLCGPSKINGDGSRYTGCGSGPKRESMRLHSWAKDGWERGWTERSIPTSLRMKGKAGHGSAAFPSSPNNRGLLLIQTDVPQPHALLCSHTHTRTRTHIHTAPTNPHFSLLSPLSQIKLQSWGLWIVYDENTLLELWFWIPSWICINKMPRHHSSVIWYIKN